MRQATDYDCLPTALAVLAGVDRRAVPGKATPGDFGWTQADLMYVARDLGLKLSPFPDVAQYADEFRDVLAKNEGILLGTKLTNGRGHALVIGPGWHVLDPAIGTWYETEATHRHLLDRMTHRIFFAK